MNIRTYLRKRKELIDEYLKVVLPFQDTPGKLRDSIWYCMLNGGKRIRPIMMLAVLELVDEPIEEILNSCAGIEMVHTSTLILDDLPSMDDALLRRNKPALHRVYGEAISILAANVLLLEGIRLIEEDLITKISDSQILKKLITELLTSIGKDGIMFGQFLDLTLSNRQLKLSEVKEIHRKKTVSLFEISVKIAGIMSKMAPLQLKAVTDYAQYFGMAFQISDDVIALENKPAISGKISLTKDRRANYISVFGEKETKKRLNDYINKAIASLEIFKDKAEHLIDLALYLKERNF